MLLLWQVSQDVSPPHASPTVFFVETVYRNVYIYAGIDPYVSSNGNALHSVFHTTHRNIGIHRGLRRRVYT
jgi:hypothetical protein